MYSHMDLSQETSTPYYQYFLKLKNAIQLEKDSDYEGSLRALTEMINEYPDIPSAYTIRGENYEKVAELFEKFPNSEPIAKLKKYILEQSNAVLSIIPIDSNLTEYYSQQTLKLALNDYDKALSIDPEDEKTLLERANILIKLENEEEAANAFTTYEIINTNIELFQESYHLELITYLKDYFDNQIRKSSEKIPKDIKEFLDAEPGGYNGELTKQSGRQTRLGMKAIDSNPKIALYHFETAMRFFNFDFIASTYYAYLNFKLYNQGNGAILVFDEVIKHFHYPMAYMFRASVNYMKNKTETIYDDITYFLKFASFAHFMRFEDKKTFVLNTILHPEKGFEEEWEYKTNMQSFVNAKNLLKTHNYKKTIKETNKLLLENPLDSDLYLLQKNAYIKLKNPEQALLAISLAIYVSDYNDPRLKEFFAMRAKLLAELEHPMRSVIDYYQAQSYLQGDARIRQMDEYLSVVKDKGMNLVKANPQDPVLILRYFEIILSQRKSPIIYQIIGDCHFSLNDYLTALSYYIKSKALDDNPQIQKRINDVREAYAKPKMEISKSLSIINNIFDNTLQPAANVTSQVEPQISAPHGTKKDTVIVSNNFINNAIHKKKEPRKKFFYLEDKPKNLGKDFLAEKEKQRQLELDAKFAREKERKAREKETAKLKRHKKLNAKYAPQENTSEILASHEPLESKTPQKNPLNSNIEILSALNLWSKPQILINAPIKVVIPILEVEKIIFARVKDFFIKNNPPTKRGLKIRGGSVVDRIRTFLNVKNLENLESDVDFVTEIDCNYLIEIFPHGVFNLNQDGCFSFFETVNNKIYKIDIFYLPDLKPHTLLANSDFFPFTGDENGNVDELEPWGFESLKNNKLKFIHHKKPFTNPIVILRFFYHLNKRNFEVDNENIFHKIKKAKHTLTDRSLVKTEKLNYWINQLCAYGKAEKNYHLLTKYGILEVLFPHHIQALITNNSWVNTQMAACAEITKEKYPIIQRVYSSYVIAIVMYNLKSYTMQQLNIAGYAKIYEEAVNVIGGSHYFAAVFSTDIVETNDRPTLTEKTKSYLEPAIKKWFKEPTNVPIQFFSEAKSLPVTTQINNLNTTPIAQQGKLSL